MFIREIRVENFGPFNGLHKVDLVSGYASTAGKPIKIIGGLNGSGKTSLLEAIRLCLHGKRALGTITNDDYRKHILNRFHKDLDGISTIDCMVGIEVEVVQSGITNVYGIERNWGELTSTLKETLDITCDGAKLNQLYPEQYQAFLDELVPLGLAEFFFFDGERIQTLAEDEGTDSVVADSIKSLLGLDIASRLQGDLALYSRTKARSLSTGELQSELNKINADHLQKTQEIENFEGELFEIDLKVSALERQIALQENKISSEGGDFAKKRDELIADRSRWQTILMSKESELRESANGLLPFCMAPNLFIELRNRLLHEREIRQEDAVSKALEVKRDELLEIFSDDGFWSEQLGQALPGPDQLKLRQIVLDNVNRTIPGNDTSSYESALIIHDLSHREIEQILMNIEEVVNGLPGHAARLSGEAEEAQQRLRDIERDLNRAPNEGVLEPLLGELGELHNALSTELHLRKGVDEQLKASIIQKSEIERSLRKQEELVKGTETSDSAVLLASKIQSVLTSYQQELMVSRVQSLGQYVTECYKRLVHKQSLCQEIRFDAETLSLKLHDAHGNLVYRPHLSAGEKQILAISILWGLGRSSGRDLPIIVDTPLARLDSGHRVNLVSHYFPEASHQMVLLSTDSEINDEELRLLSSKTYSVDHLVFDPELNESTIEPGYLSTMEVAFAN